MSEQSPTPEISVVVPVYNEEAHLVELRDRVVQVLEGEDLDFEIVLVDDGSIDESSKVISSLHGLDRRVRSIELARNFGKEKAILAGLDHSRGRAVVVMDGDLQNPPELLPEMIAAWRKGALIVDGIRVEHSGQGALRRIGTRIFYWLMQRSADVDIVVNASDFRLMDERVVKELRRCREPHRFNRALVSWAGFPRTAVEFRAPARVKGDSRWGTFRLVGYALDALCSVGWLPLRISGLIGVGVSLVSFIYLGAVVADRLFGNLEIPGYASLAGGLFFLGGVQLLTIWVLGEYVGRIYEQGKGRPAYLVRRRLGCEQDSVDSR